MRLLIRLIIPLLRSLGNKRWGKQQWLTIAVIAVILGANYLWPVIQDWLVDRQGQSTISQTGEANYPSNNSSSNKDVKKLLNAFQQERSKVWVKDIEFTVVKLLSDDNVGSRHQRFLVRHPEYPETLLISHNIDLAEYIPLKVMNGTIEEGLSTGPIMTLKAIEKAAG